MNSFLVAIVAVAIGYLTGKAIQSFVDFITEVNNKNNRRD